jgi:phosphoribosylformimino-5-aminoimidazole carboxamide ribonucleotide (ProFAR) isomerase
LGVIASGGVASLEDLARLEAAGNIEGAIIGQALYTGVVSLADAIRTARSLAKHGSTL